jgi:hypothetical protein
LVSSEAFLGNRALIACDHGRIELAEPLLGTESVKVSMHAPIEPAARAEGRPSSKKRAVEALKSSALLRRVRANYLKRDGADFQSYGVNPYVPQIEEAVRCVSQGELQSPLMPVEHTVETLRVIERLQELA